MAGHFGVPLETIRKNDRHLHYFHALTPEFVRHLNLETVAVGPDLIEIDRLQRPAAEALVPARWIGETHAGDDLDVFGGAFAQHQPAQRPVNNPNPIEITGTQHEVSLLR